jgi:hypothetical protein
MRFFSVGHIRWRRIAEPLKFSILGAYRLYFLLQAVQTLGPPPIGGIRNFVKIYIS